MLLITQKKFKCDNDKTKSNDSCNDVHMYSCVVLLFHSMNRYGCAVSRILTFVQTKLGSNRTICSRTLNKAWLITLLGRLTDEMHTLIRLWMS